MEGQYKAAVACAGADTGSGAELEGVKSGTESAWWQGENWNSRFLSRDGNLV